MNDYTKDEKFLQTKLLDSTFDTFIPYNKGIYDIVKLYNDKQDNINAFMNFLKENGLEKSPDALLNYYYFLGHFYFNKSDLNVKVEDVINKFNEINKDYPQNNSYLRYFIMGSKGAIMNNNNLNESKFVPVESSEEEIIEESEEIPNIKENLKEDLKKLRQSFIENNIIEEHFNYGENGEIKK